MFNLFKINNSLVTTRSTSIKNFKYFLVALTIFAIYSGCKKDEIIGPAGPSGATGPTGPTGNANVSRKTIAISDWTNTNNYWYADIVDTDITQDIVNNGVVLVYYEIASGQWASLPYQDTSTLLAYTYSYIYSQDNLHVRRTDFLLPTPNPSTQNFKIVIMKID